MQKMIGYGLLDRIIYGCVDMECLYYLLHVISFKDFVVCACFVEGMSNGCDDFCWLFFNGFWKWWALQRLRRMGLWRGWGMPR